MDPFARQTAAAKQRHASPEPDTEPAAPPPVHDPQRPSRIPTLAGRRGVSPRPQAVHTERAATPPAEGTVKSLPSDYDSDEVEIKTSPQPADSEVPQTPSSPLLTSALQRVAPQLLDDFLKFNDRKNDLIKGWHHEYLILRRREEERTRSRYVPEEENPEVLRRNGERARARAADVEGTLDLPRGMPDSDDDDDDGDGGSGDRVPGGWERSANDIFQNYRRAQMNPEDEERRTTKGSRKSNTAGRTQAGDKPHSTTSSTSPYSSNGSYPQGISLPSTVNPAAAANNKTASKSSSEGGVPISSKQLSLSLEVKMHLIPALVLLSTPQSALNAIIVRKADLAARAAYYAVRNSNAYKTPLGRSLNGRCCFYRGMCRLAKGLLDGKDHKAEIWFKRAVVDATGVFVEGTWAEELLRAAGAEGSIVPPSSAMPTNSVIQTPENASPTSPAPAPAELERPMTADSVMSPAANARPGTAGSWVSGLWDKVMQKVKPEAIGAEGAKPPPFSVLNVMDQKPLLADIARDESADSPMVSPKSITALPPTTRHPTRPGLGDRIPTWTTLETSKFGSVSTEYDDQGIKWSKSRPFGKGEPIAGKPLDFVMSPDRYSGHNSEEWNEGDAETDIPYNLRGGHVPLGKLRTPKGSFSDQGKMSELFMAKGTSGSESGGGASLGTAGFSGEQDTDIPQQPEPQQRYRIVNGAPPTDSSSSDAHSGAASILPLHEHSQLPYQPPQETPSPHHSPRRSIAFSALDHLSFATRKSNDSSSDHQQQTTSPSPASSVGLYARRKLSVAFGMSIATGQETDPLAKAEEGGSPYRPTFGDGGVLLEKKSGGSASGGGEQGPRSPEEMV